MTGPTPAPERHVLILDGDHSFADGLAQALTAAGYAVRLTAPSEAIAAISDFESGVVLCDVQNPAAAGTNLPAQILAARPDLICVAMARRPNFRQAVSPLSDDALAYINKNDRLEAAIAVVEKCFRKLQSRAHVGAAEDSVASAKKAVEAANHAKLEFLAKVSHELRTPLNAIIGFSELIMRDVRTKFGNEQHRAYIEDIHSSGRHLLDIINDILDFARAEAGKLVLQESEVDLKDVTTSLKRMVGPKAREAGIELIEILPENLPRLWCDERKLKQMLLNLLGNAVKFTPAQGRITLEAVESDLGLAIGVRDSGIGIAPADIAKVLQPFIQVDTTWTRQQEGTGLGLPLVKAMIELHGGRMEIESELTKGTTVKLLFPKDRIVALREEFEPEPKNRAAAQGGA